MGDYPTARGMCEDVLARRRKILGTDHPDMPTTAADLAATVRDQGDYAVARAMFDDVLTRQRALLGEDHPDTVAVRRALTDIESDDL